MDKRVSRKLIAEMSGVSKTTVTRILANRENVSEETRRKVMEVVEGFGYTPNRLAKNLSSNRNSNSVAMLVPELTNYYYLKIFDSMVAKFEKLDYDISIHQVMPSNYFTILDKVIENRVCAIINLSFMPINSDHMKKLESAGIKIIHPGIGKDPVRIHQDYASAMDKAFAALTKKGCKNFRFITGVDKSFFDDGRVQTFIALVGKYGLNFSEKIIYWGEYPNVSSLLEGHRIMTRLLQEDPSVDVIFCLNDMMALGVLKAIENSGRKAGKDISVIGFDNISLGEYSCPALTTIDSDVEQETQYYVDYILGKDNTNPSIIADYIERESTV